MGEYYPMLRGKARTFVFEKVRFLKADTFFSGTGSTWRELEVLKRIFDEN